MKDFLPNFVLDIMYLLYSAGGKPLLVGGCVRDYYCGQALKDFDIEVFHLSFEKLKEILESVGKFHFVGNSFGVFKMKYNPVDISLPRRDNKIYPGHKGFQVTFDPHLPFKEAAQRRDLTMNSMGFDIFACPEQQWLDPFQGRTHIDQRKLCATDSMHFVEDPLRALRVMQLGSRFNMVADDQLIQLCQQLNLNELAKERILEEFQKWIISPFPKLGIDFLHQTQLIRYFPGLVEIPEKFYQTVAKISNSQNLKHRSLLSWICLYYLLPQMHKPVFLSMFHFSHQHRQALIACNAAFCQFETCPNKFNFLNVMRKIKTVSFQDFQVLLQCLGFQNLVHHLQDWGIQETLPRPIVTAHHLINRGMKPGKDLGIFLQKCLDYQDKGEEKDPEKIIAGVKEMDI